MTVELPTVYIWQDGPAWYVDSPTGGTHVAWGFADAAKRVAQQLIIWKRATVVYGEPPRD